MARRDAAKKLADHLIGGISIGDLPAGEISEFLTEVFGGVDFVLPPIPNTLFQRDPSCWIYGRVTVNPMYWPARKPETLLQRAVYKFHPMFTGAKIWWGDSDEDFAGASVERNAGHRIIRRHVIDPAGVRNHVARGSARFERMDDRRNVAADDGNPAGIGANGQLIFSYGKVLHRRILAPLCDRYACGYPLSVRVWQSR